VESSISHMHAKSIQVWTPDRQTLEQRGSNKGSRMREKLSRASVAECRASIVECVAPIAERKTSIKECRASMAEFRINEARFRADPVIRTVPTDAHCLRTELAAINSPDSLEAVEGARYSGCEQSNYSRVQSIHSRAWNIHSRV
jgi:hypothetical protein